MRRILRFSLLLSFLLAACSPTAQTSKPVTLTVFAAASLTDAFTEIGKGFEAAHPGVTVTFNFAGSQALRTQIEEGAPVDVFASANTKEMDTLVAGAQVAPGAPQIFLTNKLVIIVPEGNPAAIAKPEDLANSGLKLVLAAGEVPVGNYARQSLELMNAVFGVDFKEEVFANVVSNEDNVRQVVAKVQLGEADAGIVYASDTAAAPELQTIEIPTELNVIAKYPIAALVQVESPKVAAAAQFVEYILSAEAQGILQKWGFAPPIP